jgi:hypothetical protein
MLNDDHEVEAGILGTVEAFAARQTSGAEINLNYISRFEACGSAVG